MARSLSARLFLFQLRPDNFHVFVKQGGDQAVAGVIHAQQGETSFFVSFSVPFLKEERAGAYPDFSFPAPEHQAFFPVRQGTAGVQAFEAGGLALL